MKIFSILPFIILSFFTSLNAQVSFDIGEISGNQFDVVCVPVTVSDFNNIQSFSWSVLYDDTELAVTGVNFLAPAASPLANTAIPGVVNIIWLFDLFTGSTLPDDEVVLEICFQILGPPGTVSPLTFSDGTLPNTITPDVTNGNAMTEPIGQLDPGWIQTIGGGGAFMVTYGSCSTLDIANPIGAVQVLVTGGVPPYSGTYTQIGNPGNSGSFIFFGGAGSTPSNLPPGDYTITINDSNMDTEVSVITIVEAVPLLLTLNNINPTCPGLADGSLELNGNDFNNLGGIAPHTITWSNSAMGTLIQNGLPQGSYSVTVVDNNGCVAIETESLIDPPLLTVDSINQTNVSCFGNGADGSLMVSGMGGTLAGGSDYTYSWTGPMGFTSTLPNISNLIPGQYCVIVQDDNSCFSSQRCFDLIVDQGPVITGFNTIGIGCPGDMNGSITVQFTGGTNPPETFMWSNLETTATISNLGEGTYTVTIMDAAGCTDTASETLTAPNPLIIASVTETPPTCPEGMNGLLGVTPSGGSGSYNYLWEDGQNTAAIFGLTCGQFYSFTISDGSSCPAIEDSIFLDCPPAIFADFSISVVQDVTCNGQIPCDGSASVLGTGGTTGSGFYNFLWENGESANGVSQSTATMLCQGWNSVTISDLDCFIEDSVFVGAPPSIDISAQQIVNISCNMGSDGSITVDASGGVGPYIYAWQGGPSGQTYDNLSTGTYNVVVTDGNMCTHDVDIFLPEPAPVVVQVIDNYTNDPSCNGEEDGSIELAFSGGNAGPANYNWSPNVSTSNIANNLGAGTYDVTVTDSKMCTGEISYTLMEPPLIDFTLDNIIEPPCYGEQAVVNVLNASGGTGGPYSYSVGSSTRRPISQSILVLAENNLSVKVYDDNGCFEEVFVDINQPTEIVAEFGATIEEVDLGESTFLNPFIISDLPIDSLIWSPLGSLACLDSTNLPVSCQNVEVFPENTTNYTLTVVDINGCLATATIQVDVDKTRNIFIPNAFSPNEDGRNDLHSIFVGPGIEEIKSVQVFSRWGELVYQKDAFQPLIGENTLWDGYLNDKIMNPGVFVYLITISFIDDVEFTYRGDITLMR